MHTFPCCFQLLFLKGLPGCCSYFLHSLYCCMENWLQNQRDMASYCPLGTAKPVLSHPVLSDLYCNIRLSDLLTKSVRMQHFCLDQGSEAIAEHHYVMLGYSQLGLDASGILKGAVCLVDLGSQLLKCSGQRPSSPKTPQAQRVCILDTSKVGCMPSNDTGPSIWHLMRMTNKASLCRRCPAGQPFFLSHDGNMHLLCRA